MIFESLVRRWKMLEDFAVDLVAFGNQEWEWKILFIKGGLNGTNMDFLAHVWSPAVTKGFKQETYADMTWT